MAEMFHERDPGRGKMRRTERVLRIVLAVLIVWIGLKRSIVGATSP